MIKPALTAKEWKGVIAGSVGIVGTPDIAAQHQVAAVCLYGQPFGFDAADLHKIGVCIVALQTDQDAFGVDNRQYIAWLESIRERIQALLPREEKR